MKLGICFCGAEQDKIDRSVGCVPVAMKCGQRTPQGAKWTFSDRRLQVSK